MSSKRPLVAAVAVTLLILAFAFTRFRAPSEGASTELPLPPERAGAHRYALSYESAQQGPEPLSGSLTLEAELVLDRHDATFTTLTVASCAALSWRALSQDILPDEPCAHVVGASVVMEHDAHGALVAVHVPPDQRPEAEHLLRGLAGELSFERRAAAAWQVQEKTVRGVVESAYARADAATFARTRTSGPAAAAGATVTGTATLHVEGGALHTLALDEATAGGTTSTTRLRLTRLGPATATAPPVLSRWTRRRPGDVSATASDELMRQRIDGYTVEALLRDLAQFADGGTMPDHERFLWRASALLRSNPAYPALLEPLFLDGVATHARRGLLLDLLAAAASPTAQASMRTLLDSDVARARDDQFALYVQRLALPPLPAAETHAWLAQNADRAVTDNERLSVAYTWASVVRRRGDADPAARRAVAERFARELDTTTSDTTRAHLVRCIGATAEPTQEPLLVEALQASAGERLAAVQGLTRLGAHDAIRTVLPDADRLVQAAALRAVPLDEKTASALVTVIDDDELQKDNVALLVRRLGQSTDRAAAARIARALVDKGHARGAHAALLHGLSG